MRRVVGLVIGGGLILLGAVALFGAIEVARGGSAEAVAQAFLVPATLFVLGGFAVAMAFRAPGDGDRGR